MDVSALQAERSRLVAIAARILGATAEADDVVQEAWLRLSSADDIDDPPAWLTTVVTRLCLDQLRKQATRSRAEAAAPTATDRDPVDPEADAVTIDGELGAAWIVGSTVKVAFAFHTEAGLVREIELIADPEVLATMDVVPVGGR